MRPQAGVGKLKHAPPMRANDLPLVAQAVSPANHICSHLLTLGAFMSTESRGYSATRRAAGNARCGLAVPRPTRQRLARSSWRGKRRYRSEEHTFELQSPCNLVCRLLLE